MKQTPALNKLNAKLATRNDDQLLALYSMSDVMQDAIEMKDPRYKEYSVVKVCIEEELVRRHGQETGSIMIDSLCNALY